MDQIGIQSGRPVFIEEIVSPDVDARAMHEMSVCLTGRLVHHDVDGCMAKLTDPQSKMDVYVDTSLIEPFGAKFGSLFQMIGELDYRSGQYGTVLKARVVRCVDGMDLVLYRKAIQCQRMYLDTRIAN